MSYYLPLAEDSLFLSSSILESLADNSNTSASNSLDIISILLGGIKTDSSGSVIGNLTGIEDLLRNILEVPLQAIFDSLNELVSNITAELSGILASVGLDLSGVTSTLESLSNIIFGEGETFLTNLFGESVLSINSLLDSIDITFGDITGDLLGDIGETLSSIDLSLTGVASTILESISENLDGAFEELGISLQEITSGIDAIINPLSEAFSSFNLSVEGLGSKLLSSLSTMFDIDIDKLADVSIQLNKRMMQLRADELLR